jgi:RNA polymerase sigma factor (sigma-70 family)
MSEDFERLLSWLAPDREQAAWKYEDIRRSLIKIFVWRGVAEAEDLADETIMRVTQKVGEIASSYVGDPAAYVYSVGNKVFQEYWRRRKLHVPLGSQRLVAPVPVDDPDTIEKEYECLNRCVEQLSPEDRKLIWGYYAKERQAKIEHRKELAERLNIGLNALRVRVYRIRAALEECIEKCMETEST